MKILYIPKNSSNILSVILVSTTVQKFRLRLCYTITCNSPGHGIKKPVKYLFSMKFISGW